MPGGVFPDLQTQGGLSFPWAEYVTKQGGISDGSFGNTGGTTLGMCIIINYEDLQYALRQLLGYSFRDTSQVPSPNTTPLTPGRLSRVLPWNHPMYTNLWCTRINSVKGFKFTGKDTAPDFGDGPTTEYTHWLLTLQFGRPAYSILSDTAIQNKVGFPQEWLRYTDRNWFPSVQMLTRQGQTFVYTQGTDGALSPNNTQFPGSIGQKLGKMKIQRTWYQIPEACIFDSSGMPVVPFLNNTPATASFVVGQALPFAGGSGYSLGDQITLAVPGSTSSRKAVVTVTRLIAVPGEVFEVVVSDGGAYTVLPSGVLATQDSVSPAGGSGATFAVTSQPAVTVATVLGTVNSGAFFGCATGTLLYEGVEIKPSPIPMPAELMFIASQIGSPFYGETFPVQYDVTYHFEYFDPPRGGGVTMRGHNLMPWAGTGLWYPVASRTGGYRPFQSYDFYNLFSSL